MRTKSAPAAGLAVLFLTACGGTSGQGSTAAPAGSPASGGSSYDQLAKPDPSVDACRLLTSTDAEAIVGSPVTQGSLGPAKCSYAGPASEIVGVEVVTVAIFNAFRKATVATGGTIEAASGIGDEAYYVPQKDGKDVTLYVRKGTKTFEVIDTPSSSSQPYGARKSAVQKAAVQAVGRL